MNTIKKYPKILNSSLTFNVFQRFYVTYRENFDKSNDYLQN